MYIFNVQIPLNDAPEPMDFEDYVVQNQCMVERDPYKDLLLYPDDDIQVHKVPKTCRTMQCSMPESGSVVLIQNLDCISLLIKAIILLKRK